MGHSNHEVVKAWKRGEALRSSNGNLRSDGYNLYSYQMKIGTRVNGYLLVLNVRGQYRYSQTTSQHVSLAASVADKVVTPIVTHHGWSGWRVFPHEEYGAIVEKCYPDLFPDYVQAPTPNGDGSYENDAIGVLIALEDGELSEDDSAAFFDTLADLLGGLNA